MLGRFVFSTMVPASATAHTLCAIAVAEAAGSLS